MSEGAAELHNEEREREREKERKDGQGKKEIFAL